MKKLISILLLFTGIVKGQIVGGPITSTSTNTLTNKTIVSPTITGTAKIASVTLSGPITGTASNVTFSNIIAGGTQSVVGNSTLANVVSAGTASFGTGTSTFSNVVANGNTTLTLPSYLYQQTASLSIMTGTYSSIQPAIYMGTTCATPNATNYVVLKANASAQFNDAARVKLNVADVTQIDIQTSDIRLVQKTKIGANSAATATLDVAGDAKVSTTFSLGAANLTGGNTGTVAVLSDALFTTTHFHGLATVGTSAFFYDGYPSSSGVGGTSGTVGRTYIPFNCTLVGYSIFTGVLGTLGSANTATAYVRVNNTTDVLLNATTQYSAAAQSYSASNLSTSITAGDYIEIKRVPNCTPTAATNVTEKITLFFARRP